MSKGQLFRLAERIPRLIFGGHSKFHENDHYSEGLALTFLEDGVINNVNPHGEGIVDEV